MFFKAAILLVSSVAVAMAQLTISSPASLLTCQPVLLSWTGGVSPYFLTVLPGGQVSGTPLKQFGQVSANTLTWTVDIAAATSITLQVTDSTGVNAYSSPITVQAGSSTSCINGATTESNTAPGSSFSAVSSSVSSSASSESSVSSSSASSSRSSVSSVASVSSTSAAAASSSASAPTSSTTSGANMIVAGFGSIALGAAAIALLA